MGYEKQLGIQKHSQSRYDHSLGWHVPFVRIFANPVFWEPMIGAEFDSDEEWKAQPYRIGVQLHPLTIEQNAITSFKSRTTLVPCRANTIGPGLMFQADYAIGGADGALSRGMQWQGMSLWMTLRYGPTRYITSSYIPTLPGRLFFLEELAGPLVAEAN